MYNPDSIFDAVKHKYSIEAFVPSILPNGKISGSLYMPLNPTRSDNNPGSFVIDLRTGWWRDFATNDAGGDIISLYAYIKGIGQYEAAKELMGSDMPDHKMQNVIHTAPNLPKANSLKLVRKIWGKCRASKGSLVEKYLAMRGIK
jgi:hypothetical protein